MLSTFISPTSFKTKIVHPLMLSFNAFLLLMVLTIPSFADTPNPIYKIDYKVELQPEKDRAYVIMAVDKGKLLRRIQFDVDPKIYTDLKANGKFEIKNGRAHWHLPEKNAQLSFHVKISNERDPGEYDALMKKDWAIFRGDNIIPAIYTDEILNAESKARLEFKLPEGWSIETGWPRIKGDTFRIDNPERRFDRPVGWMIAGKLGTRRSKVGDTSIAVSAPKGSSMRRMDALTFLGFVWPELEKAFDDSPKKLLILGQDDPMWRGGLSASNSLFLHADRPMVSENGTSPLLHELVHMVTRISGEKNKTHNDDWIAEGLAEFYSIELLYRAEGMTKERRKQIMTRLGKWGKDVKNLRQSRSHGAVTGRAVVLLNELDQEIRSRSKHNLDDVTRQLMAKRKVSLDDLREIVEDLIGEKAKSLQSPLLKD